MKSPCRRTIGALCVVMLAGCSAQGAPPFDELPLRDALRAEPAALRSIPPAARAALARRLLAEALPEGPSHTCRELAAAEAARTLDERRRGEGRDAPVLAWADDEGACDNALSDAGPAQDAGDAGRGHESEPPQGDSGAGQDANEPGDAARAHENAPSAGPSAVDPSHASAPSWWLFGARPTSTADEETLALAGRAGAVLDEIARRAGTSRVERVTGWPVGVLARGPTLYVNGTWLAALGSLEAPGNLPANVPLVPAVGAQGEGPPLGQPLGLRGNPYWLYPTLGACADDVRTRCASCVSSGACDERPTLRSFTDARAECVWIDEDPARAEALCVAGLTSVTTVSECVRARNAACAPLPGPNDVATVESAAALASRPECVDALNQCLGGSTTARDAGADGGGGSVTVVLPPLVQTGSCSCGGCNGPSCTAPAASPPPESCSGPSCGGCSVGSCQNTSSGGGTGSSGGGSSCSGCSSCSSPSCSSCSGPSCSGSGCSGSSCGGSSCGGSSCGGSSCGGSSCGGSSCGRCVVAPERASQNAPRVSQGAGHDHARDHGHGDGLVDALRGWVGALAPLAFLLLRSRRTK